jgi:hypothetical protein
MTDELSQRDHELLDTILYLRHELKTLLPKEEAEKLEGFLSQILDDFNAPLTPPLVISLIREIRKYEPARARLEKLSGQYTMSYSGPAKPDEEKPIIRLGEMVVCPEEGHSGIDPYLARLRKHGQRCPIHNVYLVPYKEEKD